MSTKKKVIVGMSGGVDSSVAAALLLEQGYDVTGIYMKNWSTPMGGGLICPWEQDIEDAHAAAQHLGIEFRSLSYEKEYRKRVVDYMIEEYSRGRTPNPDVMCNSEIKFKLFFDEAIKLGADYVATGHYARIKNGQLLKGIDSNKDQSYFLYRINPNILGKVLFPVGDLEKPRVRELAKKFGLLNADKKDSTGVCFIGEFSMMDFLKEEIASNVGNIVDIESSVVVGTHDGIEFYTIGQRHGFGGGGGVPYYVAGKDHKTNTIYVAPGRNHDSLLSKEIVIDDIHLLSAQIKGSITAKIRYRGEEYDIGNIKGNIVTFKNSAWAATPGQSIVFYDGDICLGGAVINTAAPYTLNPIPYKISV